MRIHASILLFVFAINCVKWFSTSWDFCNLPQNKCCKFFIRQVFPSCSFHFSEGKVIFKDCFNAEKREESPTDLLTWDCYFMFSHFTFRRPQFPKYKTCWMSCGQALNAFEWGNSSVIFFLLSHRWSLRIGEVMMRVITEHKKFVIVRSRSQWKSTVVAKTQIELWKIGTLEISRGRF